MLRNLQEILEEARDNLRCISAVTAIAEAKENKGVLIDVREPVEAQAKSVVASINIPRGVLEMKISDLASSAEHPIYLHCASGGRAVLAAEQLARMGYSNISVITCPIDTIFEAHNDEGTSE